jgi:hypothetical protein
VSKRPVGLSTRLPSRAPNGNGTRPRDRARGARDSHHRPVLLLAAAGTGREVPVPVESHFPASRRPPGPPEAKPRLAGSPACRRGAAGRPGVPLRRFGAGSVPRQARPPGVPPASHATPPMAGHGLFLGRAAQGEPHKPGPGLFLGRAALGRRTPQARGRIIAWQAPPATLRGMLRRPTRRHWQLLSPGLASGGHATFGRFSFKR